MSCNEKSYIVRDSKNNFCKFYLTNKELITQNINKDQITLKKDVLDYALDIDTNDNIHIIYFNDKGELNYSIYNDTNEERNILVVNNNYTIDYLLIKIIDLRIHIFYRAGKLKENGGSIYHNFFIKDNWIDKEVAKICCPKYICPYYIDYHNDIIYMLYCSNYVLGEYVVKKFDFNKNLWQDFEDNIIIKDASSLNYFITPSNLEVICFSKFINNNLQVLIRFKYLNNLDKLWSSDLNVSRNNVNTFRPLIFYRDNYIYVMWREEDRIVYRKSDDMFHWSKKIEIKINSENICRALYLSNICENYNIKISYIYVPDIEFLISITSSKFNCYYNTVNTAAITTDVINDNTISDINIYNKVLSKKRMNSNNNSIVPLEKSYTNSDKYKNNYTETLLNEIRLKDININNLNELNFELSKQINKMNNLINKYENKLQSLKIKQAINKKKYSKTIYNYENYIKILGEDKNSIIIEMNEKIQALLKVIEEKENIIQKLYNIVERREF